MRRIEHTIDLLETHPDLVVDIADSLPLKQLVEIINHLTEHLGLALLYAMHPWKSKSICDLLPQQKIDGIVTSASLTNALPILKKMSPEKRAKSLKAFPRKEREHLKTYLTYPQESVGAWMNHEPYSVRVGDRFDKIFAELGAYTGQEIFTCYVLDQENKLSFSFSLLELIQLSSHSEQIQLQSSTQNTLTPYQSFEKIKSLSEWKNVMSMPVVDDKNMLIGEVTHLHLKAYELENHLGDQELKTLPATSLSESTDALSVFFKGLTDFLPPSNKRG